MPYFDDLLSASIAHLNLLYPTFDQYYLTSSEPIPPSSEDEPVHLSHLISSILDFVATVIRGGKAKQWFTPEHSTALIAAVFNYAQMTDEDVSAGDPAYDVISLCVGGHLGIQC